MAKLVRKFQNSGKFDRREWLRDRAEEDPRSAAVRQNTADPNFARRQSDDVTNTLSTIGSFTPAWPLFAANQVGRSIDREEYGNAAVEGAMMGAPFAIGKGIQAVTPYIRQGIKAVTPFIKNVVSTIGKEMKSIAGVGNGVGAEIRPTTWAMTDNVSSVKTMPSHVPERTPADHINIPRVDPLKNPPMANRVVRIDMGDWAQNKGLPLILGPKPNIGARIINPNKPQFVRRPPLIREAAPADKRNILNLLFPKAEGSIYIGKNIEAAGEYPRVTSENIEGILKTLKQDYNGSFIKRSNIGSDYVYLDKVPREFEAETPFITSELHSKFPGITPVHQSLTYHQLDPLTKASAGTSNLQLQKKAAGNFLYRSDYSNLTQEAIDEAKEALLAGRRSGLNFDFTGNNNTLYDPVANKFNFIDMSAKAKSYNQMEPIESFVSHLTSGIKSNLFNTRGNSNINFDDFLKSRSIRFKKGGRLCKRKLKSK